MIAYSALVLFVSSLDKEQTVVAASCVDKVQQFGVDGKFQNVIEFIHDIV